MVHWKICVSDSSEVSLFAAMEFSRLVVQMDSLATTEVCRCDFEQEGACLWIGLHLPSQVLENSDDDVIHIDVQNGKGVITGSNERSVLIGVYRFFREVGCVFVRPGRDGEYIPRKDSLSLTVALHEMAAYRCRGICLEGSNSFENVMEMIDLAPKLGFNAFFTQLFRPAFAFKRWYGHQSNPCLLPTPVSDATIDSFVRDYDVEIRRRGLIHHRIGHGWVSKLLGITSGAWHEPNNDEEVLPERRGLLALINGKRCLFKGSGIDTNLCYSMPEVKELLAEEVATYARQNPEVRYLHFWLADQANNQCECAACKEQRPADQYVEILNRIDEKLTAEGLPTKIVFLIYLDLLWEPVHSRLRNPGRFVLMYAPIRRSYSVPMASDCHHEAAPFVRNGFKLTSSAGGTLPYLKAWQKVFDGDSFVFDYHYMWDYINDPGCFQSIRILAKDVENLKQLGLNGMMSCQNLRVFMPNGFGMTLLGEVLWSGKAAFQEHAERYFKAAYGKDAVACMAYLEKLSCGFEPEVLRGERPLHAPDKYEAIQTAIHDFMPVIQKNLSSNTSTIQKRSWECLAFHAELGEKLAVLLADFARKDSKRAADSWQAVRLLVCQNEMRFQREFDVFEILNVWENKILPRLEELAK